MTKTNVTDTHSTYQATVRTAPQNLAIQLVGIDRERLKKAYTPSIGHPRQGTGIALADRLDQGERTRYAMHPRRNSCRLLW